MLPLRLRCSDDGLLHAAGSEIAGSEIAGSEIVGSEIAGSEIVWPEIVRDAAGAGRTLALKPCFEKILKVAPMPYHSWQFTHAITRRPPTSICNGLRAVDQGNPDFDRITADHRDYVAALRNAGMTVVELAPLEEFPDCCFVEDAALCLPQGAIVLRPGAVTRLGEARAMAPHLADVFTQVEAISGPGFVEGGDILVTEREILVGRSARTDAAGIAELAQIAGAWGHRVREVITPPGVLHFKTDCSLLDHQTILATPRLNASGCFADYTVIETAAGEEACANAIRVNEVVIMPAGFPKTAEILIARGYRVVTVNNTECAKVDGGMSCLSLRFTPTK